jgi:hypothetical protein
MYLSLRQAAQRTPAGGQVRRPAVRVARTVVLLGVTSLFTDVSSEMVAAVADTALAETRSVDDQAEWLDDGHLLYSLPEGNQPTAVTDTWVVPADGGGTPSLLARAAFSPAVQRR